MKGVCIHCADLIDLDAQGDIIGHSWPRPTRQLCVGSGQHPVGADEEIPEDLREADRAGQRFLKALRVSLTKGERAAAAKLPKEPESN